MSSGDGVMVVTVTVASMQLRPDLLDDARKRGAGPHSFTAIAATGLDRYGCREYGSTAGVAAQRAVRARVDHGRDPIEEP